MADGSYNIRSLKYPEMFLTDQQIKEFGIDTQLVMNLE